MSWICKTLKSITPQQAWNEHIYWDTEANRADRHCPGCGQLVTCGECGGAGEGICAEAAYAQDIYMRRAPAWEMDGPPPSFETIKALVAFWCEEG